MAGKFFKIAAIVVLALIIVPLIWSIQDSANGIDDVLIRQALIALAAFIITGVVFGAITDHLAKTKGYEAGFAWGFWLGIIGLLVVGFRPSLNQTAGRTMLETQKPTHIEMLTKLATLHEKGVLTEEEFQQKKKEILDKI